MKRKIEQELLNWKNTSQGRTAVLVEGARRVGKTYSVKKFAEENYKSYVIVEFDKASPDLKQLFYDYLDDLDQFFIYFEAQTGAKLYERESVIVFDEVQEFPKARSAIKHLVADGRYDYIETGSLISIKKNVENILIPSEERKIEMHPMDFEEFMWALGAEDLVEVTRQIYRGELELTQGIHRKMTNYFRQYMIIGGMPQAVEKWVQEKDFEEVDRVKRDILRLYQDDIRKHAGRDALKAGRIFQQIPAQLSRHEKKFVMADLGENARYREYADAIFWLDEAKVINVCYGATEPNVGLNMNLDSAAFKCYMGDTGLLISHAFDGNNLMSEEVYKKILSDKLSFNEGMIFENAVAQMLVALGRNLYFYAKYSRESDERMEIDFLIAKNRVTARHNISAIEVKSGKNYTTKSLEKFVEKYKDYIDKQYIVHMGIYEEREGRIYLPAYMVMFL